MSPLLSDYRRVFDYVSCIWDMMFRPSLLLRCYPFSIISACASGGGLEQTTSE